MLELHYSGEDTVAPYAEELAGATFFEGRRPWEQKVDIALSCATQNELVKQMQKHLLLMALFA